MLRGEIYWGYWPNDTKFVKRPLLIINNNERSKDFKDLLVIEITGRKDDKGIDKPINPNEDMEITFNKPSIIRCGQIAVIKKSQIYGKIRSLSHLELMDLNTKLGVAIGLHK